jgi:hypothetical protein
MYREHVRIEEERVYSVADKMLTHAEKFALMEQLLQGHDDETTTTLLQFDQPQFSDPSLRTENGNTDARSGLALDAEYEDEDDDGESLEV